MAGTTTGQRVFDLAMGLMGAVDSAGLTDTADTADYKNRTLLVLNVLRGELYPFSDTYTSILDVNSVAIDGRRPFNAVIADFTTAIDLDDVIAQSVMPYGLAAHLLLDEDPATANFFQQRYEELIVKYGKCIPSVFEDITQTYGGFDVGDYADDE